MIQDPSKELTLIVYNTPKPPKYIKVNKSLLRTLVIVIPILIISSISISFVYSMYLKNKVNELRSEEPKIILALTNEKISLSNSLKSITRNNVVLTNKLSMGSSVETSNTSLGLFTSPLGIEDLRENELLKIDNLRLSSEEGKIKLAFDLANNTTEKLSGYITVVQYQGNSLQFYPNYELGEKNLRLEYSKGESFGFSRFRPTIATFDKIKNTSARYKIYIFSRTGNLIAYMQAGPFNIE